MSDPSRGAVLFCAISTALLAINRVNDHGSGFAYGGGAELIMNGGFWLRAEYERFSFDGNTNVVSLGITYRL